MDRTIPINDFPKLTLLGKQSGFNVSIDLLDEKDGIYEYNFSLKKTKAAAPQTLTLRWRLPSLNVKGVWTSASLYEKRQQYDWELKHLESRVSVHAPVVSVFGHDDINVITFACSDAINKLEMNALLREEDNHLYCHLSFFTERHPEITDYSARIRVDLRKLSFAQSLQEVSDWWTTFAPLKPAPVPSLARVPLYSSWYQFHQSLDIEALYEECKIARKIGCELIILDDGWQTMDGNRGYDFCGDWQPERIPNMHEFVENLHQIGMKFGLWFSVPFCGVKSKAYQRFKGKFLTENHRWAPVFDPRYPDVRQYLIDIYTNALTDYNLDAFKLDFIDDFQAYPNTVLTKENGRDYANVNEAVDKLMTDVMTSLRAIKPDIAIEFRQKYVGPTMRKYGNMFRAFDCPNDAVSNRIRTTDVKLLSGHTAVHADMFTWHFDEQVEIAALQMWNAVFAVPQVSVMLRDLPDDHRKMLEFYLKYWRENSETLLDGHFVPQNPISHYPILSAYKADHIIYGIYENNVIDIDTNFQKIHLINAKRTAYLACNFSSKTNKDVYVFDCMGNKISNHKITFEMGIAQLRVPPSGLILMD